jgi:hypothetical protein
MFEEVPHPCPLPQRRGNRSLLIRKDDFFGGLGLVHREAVKQTIAAGAAQCFLGASTALAARRVG